MNQWIARTMKAGLLRAGYYGSRLRRASFPGAAVLCYHGVRQDDWPSGTMRFEALHVPRKELEEHCRLIRQYCHPIGLGEWRAALRGGPPLPSRPVLLTFDDGYRTALTLARPILEKYALPAVFFLCTEPIQQQRLLWYDAVARQRGEAEVERLKGLPYDEWLAQTAEVAVGTAQAVDAADPHALLTRAEVKALAETAGMEIGGHTKDHPILARANGAQQREQIVGSKVRLEEWTGRPVTAFAYPNGRPAIDFTAETVALVRAAGYETAFTTRSGFALPQEAPLEHSRFLMLAGVSPAELAHRLCHSWRK